MALSTTITPPKGWWKASQSIATSASSLANRISYNDVPERRVGQDAAREEAGLEVSPADAQAPSFDDAFLQIDLSLSSDNAIARTEKRHKLYYDGTKEYWRSYELGFTTDNRLVYTKCIGESYTRPSDVPSHLTEITQIETPSQTSLYSFKYPIEIVGGKAIIQ